MEKNYFENVFEKVCEVLKDRGNIKCISEDFMKQSNDYMRMDFLLRLETVWDAVQLPDSGTELKSTAKSQLLRNAGNKLFQNKKYLQALHKYTESLSYAPWVDSENSVSLAYANRSAVLVHLERHQAAIDDIKRSFDCGYPQELRYKLLERRGNCLNLLGRLEDARSSYREAKVHLKYSTLDTNKREKMETEFENKINKSSSTASTTKHSNKVDCDNICPDISSRNQTFVSLSSSCDIEFSEGQGRYVVAKADIHPGDVILLEKPYASVLLPANYSDHCHYCYKHCLSLLPCEICHSALYCSQECQSKSEGSFHKTECRVLHLLEQSGVDEFAYLAFRTISSKPLDEILKYKEQVENGVFVSDDKLKLGCNAEKLYTSDEYNAICNLVTHDVNRTSHDLFRRAVIALYLLRLLERSEYFAEHAAGTPDKAMIYIGGLILGHLQSYPCNAHEISEFGLNVDNIATSVPGELGAGIYSTLSLFNHSCDPVVTRNFYGDTCVVRAIRVIHKGEKISDNYGAIYAIQSKEERWNKLKPQYFFDCQCEACIGNWPLFSETVGCAPVWRCSECRSPISKTAIPADLSQPVNCCECGSQQSIVLKRESLLNGEKSFRIAFDLLLSGQITNALPDLFSYLEILDASVCPPWNEYCSCQEAVKQCFSIMANCKFVGGH